MPEAEAPVRPPIDPEELAAFIDGRLDGERRRLMIARLAEDEDAYDLYDEVIRVREEMAAAEAAESTAPADATGRARPAVPLPAPSAATPDVPEPSREPARRRSWTFPTVSRTRTVGWFPIAAAAAAAVVAFGVWWLFRPVGALPSSEMLLAFDASTLDTPEAADEAPESLGTVFRGTGAEERAARFKLGVRAFDLALAIQVRNERATERWLAEMARLLREDPLSFDLPERYERLADRLASDAGPVDLYGGIAAAEAALQEEYDDPAQPLFGFGRWVEAVRVAAVLGDRTFLASPAAQRPLRDFLRNNPSDKVARELETVAAGLGRGAATADLAAIERALTEIEKHCADGKPCIGPSID